jgi:ABC-2 type transport system permease protein
MQVMLMRGNPMVPLVSVVQPAAFLAVFLARPGAAPPGQRAATVIAVLLTCLWSATLWTAGATLRREVAEGTLARSLTGVTDPRLVVLGKCLGATLLTEGLLLVTGAAAAALAGAALSPGGVPWLVLGAVLLTASGTAAGFALSSIFVLTRYPVQVTSALTYPVYILSGLLIPGWLLPGWLAWLSRLISLYWADEFLRRAADGAFAARPLAFLAALTAAYCLAGALLFRRVVALAKRKGTIDIG